MCLFLGSQRGKIAADAGEQLLCGSGLELPRLAHNADLMEGKVVGEGDCGGAGVALSVRAPQIERVRHDHDANAVCDQIGAEVVLGALIDDPGGKARFLAQADDGAFVLGAQIANDKLFLAQFLGGNAPAAWNSV